MSASMFAILALAALSIASGEKLTLEGATITVDADLGLLGAAAFAPACPLENPDDIPEGVSPAHGMFVLRKDRAALDVYKDVKRSQCMFPMEGAIHVVPVAGLVATASSAAAQIALLQKQLEAGVSRKRGARFPLVPFLNSALSVSARPRKWKTSTWDGIGFLAMFSQEYATLDSKNVVYVFQALSPDKKTLVVGMFPVAYAKPFPEYVPPKKNKKPEEPVWARYVTRLDGELASAAAADFSPSLSAIEATLSSLMLTR